MRLVVLYAASITTRPLKVLLVLNTFLTDEVLPSLGEGLCWVGSGRNWGYEKVSVPEWNLGVSGNMGPASKLYERATEPMTRDRPPDGTADNRLNPGSQLSWSPWCLGTDCMYSSAGPLSHIILFVPCAGTGIYTQDSHSLCQSSCWVWRVTIRTEGMKCLLLKMFVSPGLA